MSILYVTSFNNKLFHATGKNLIESFVHHKTEGNLLITHEDDIDNEIPKHWKFLFYNLDKDDYLQNWLDKNIDIIPKDLGGTHNGNFDNKFHRRTSQWFRKIAALHHAVSYNFDKLIFVDSDVYFKKKLKQSKIEEVFDGHSVFYHCGPHRMKKNSGAETGIVGYDLKKDGKEFLDKVFEKYEDGSFKEYLRWDDAWMVTAAIQENPHIRCRDICPNADAGHVVKDGLLAEYLQHDKGTHWRNHGVVF
tara:strand:+ start:197 stop:940 length:744 start_codon:yes stop_codon:yes gene_type:complete